MADFLNCKIDLSQKVFRPRIETEYWVRKAINEIKPLFPSNPEILDIFSGSGCIGIAVLKNCPGCLIDFADLDEKAIEQIKINLKLNRIPEGSWRVLRTDLFENLGDKKYDVIFSNPPYVALDRIGDVQGEVLKNDPHLALFSGKDGMECIRKFLPEAKKHLKAGGLIFMEFDPDQKREIRRIFDKEGLSYRFRKDQFGKYRWLKAGA